MPSSDVPCPFCNIATSYPPSANPNNDHERVSPSAFVVLSSPLCMAFLDIMPLSPGHMLVTTRRHHEKISDVSEEESRELGLWLPRLSRVLANVTGVWDWNIVQNNGNYLPDLSSLYSAAELMETVHRSCSGASCTACPFPHHSPTSPYARTTKSIFYDVREGSEKRA